MQDSTYWQQCCRFFSTRFGQCFFNSNEQSDDNNPLAFEFNRESAGLLVKDAYGQQEADNIIANWRSTLESVHIQSLMIQKKYADLASQHYILQSYKALLQLAFQRNHKQAEQILRDEFPNELKTALDQALERRGDHPLRPNRENSLV